MRGSAFCIRAEKNAQADDAVQKKLIDLLNLPIHSSEVKKIKDRVEKLTLLFNSLDPKTASALLTRLINPNDALGQLYSCELESSFRTALIGIVTMRSVTPDKRDKQPDDTSKPKPPEDTQEDPQNQPDPQDQPEPDDKPPPPPPKPIKPPIIKDVDDYLKDLLKWTRSVKNTIQSQDLKKKADGLENMLMQAGRLIGTGVVVSAIAYFGFDMMAGKLVLLATTEGLHYLEIRTISYFSNSPEFSEVEKALRDINSVADDLEQGIQNEQQIQQATDPVTVEPRTRGFAVEDAYVEKLKVNHGFKGLPDRWPGIDAVKGNPTVKNGVKIFRNAEGISVKSTHVTNPDTLLNTLKNNWLKPFEDKTYLHESEGIKIESLKKKGLHLIFEEDTVQKINKDTVKGMKSLAREALKKNVDFKWFVYSQGKLVDGAQFFKDMSLKGE